MPLPLRVVKATLRNRQGTLPAKQSLKKTPIQSPFPESLQIAMPPIPGKGVIGIVSFPRRLPSQTTLLHDSEVFGIIHWQRLNSRGYKYLQDTFHFANLPVLWIQTDA